MVHVNERIADMATSYLSIASGGGGHIRPVFGNYKDSERGPIEVKGTCSLVRTKDHFYAVTATHVLDHAWCSRPYIPDREGRPFALASMLWVDFVHPTSGEGYDLSWALLEQERHGRLGLGKAATLLCPHSIGKDAIWALAGFHLKRNRVNHLESGQYKPSIYRWMSDAPMACPLIPYAKPTWESPNVIEMPFDRRRFAVDRQIAPVPRGLSGGPSCYLGSLDQCMSGTMSEGPGVFGFLLSQSDRDKTIRLASANLLLNLDPMQIDSARNEEARLRKEQSV